MEDPASALLQAVLDSHHVRYKRFSQADPLQTPSSRLLRNTFAFPGSKSNFNHVLFVAEVRPHVLLAVAYSKNTVQTSGKEELLGRLLELNASESTALWKLEERRESVFPVLEMTIWLCGGEGRKEDLVWKGCGGLDVLYKSKVATLTPMLLLDTNEVGRKVRDFLEATGFKKVKESSIPFGRSYLVVMSSDEEPEESRWKRFPLKIDVTGILVFRIYFSLDDAAVTGKGRFPAAAIHLLARLNSILPVGYFNYSSGSNQIQLTLKLHYKTLSAADLTTSIKAYYDASIVHYKGTVPSLGTLYGDVEGANRSISEITSYFQLVQEDMQGEFHWVRLNYADKEPQTELDLLQILANRQEMTPYLLPKPIYKQDHRGVYVKVSRQLTQVVEYGRKNLQMQGYLYQLILPLFDTLAQIGIFPTINMIFCSATSPIQLVLVPGKGLHRNREQFLSDLAETGIGTLSLEKSTTNFSDSESIRMDWNLFEVPTRTSLDGILLSKVGLGSQDCLLYLLQESPRKPAFASDFANYTSARGRLESYPNALQGWTEAPQLLASLEKPTDLDETAGSEETAASDTSLGPQYYICERYEYMMWRGNEIVQTLCQVGSNLQTMHSEGYCHWFISPLTIRQHYRGGGEVVVVLPTLQPAFSAFIYSFIPAFYRKFIAPEAKKQIKEGILVESLFAADVYSLCRVIASKLKVSSALPALQETVARGLSEDWRERPALSEVNDLLKRLKTGSEPAS